MSAASRSWICARQQVTRADDVLAVTAADIFNPDGFPAPVASHVEVPKRYPRAGPARGKRPGNVHLVRCVHTVRAAPTRWTLRADRKDQYDVGRDGSLTFKRPSTVAAGSNPLASR